MGVVKKALGGIGDVAKKVSGIAGFIPGIGTAISGIGGALGGALGTLNDEKQGIGNFLKNALGGAVGGIGGSLGGGPLSGLGGFLRNQFNPSERVVSGVPAELQAALEAAGISIEELIQSGGALPQFGGRTGTDPNVDQLTASSGLREQLGTQRTGPDLTDFNSILKQLGETGTGDLTQTNQIIEQLRSSGADLSTSEDIISQLQGLQGPEFGGAQALIDALSAGGPGTEGTDALLAKLGSFEGADLSEVEKIIQQLQSGAPGTEGTDALLRQIQGAQGPDLSAAVDAATDLRNLQGPDTGRAAGLLDRVEGLATGPEQQRLIDTLLPSLEQATAANRFDLTDTFREGESLFRRDLDEQLADIKAESSSLGLGAGSSDRNKRLLETAGRELGRFRLGQEDLSRQSFESAESRRIAAINAGGAVSGAVSRPSETLASIVPAALEEGSRGAEFEQRGLAAALPTLLESGRLPADFDLQKLIAGLPAQLQAELRSAEIGQRGLSSALPSAVSAAGLGSNQQLQALLGSLPTSLQTELNPAEIAQRGQAAALPGALQIGQAGADFDLQKLIAGLDPSIRAALGLGGLEQAGAASALPTAFQAGIQGDQSLSDRLLAMLNPTLQGGQVGARFDLAQRGQQSQDLARLFGFGTTERGFGESEIERLIAEFGRTQTGGFDLLTRLLGATPGQTTAFGPSNVSQLGDLASGVSSALPGIGEAISGLFGSKDEPAGGAPPPLRGFGDVSFGGSGLNDFSERTSSGTGLGLSSVAGANLIARPAGSGAELGSFGSFGDFANIGAPTKKKPEDLFNPTV